MISKLDKYDVINFLGSGQFGEVYLCRDQFLEKDVAIKVIKVHDPDKFVKAVQEGRVLDKCRHLNVVDVYDVRTTYVDAELVVILIMEYLSEGSVQEFIERSFVSCKDAVSIVQQSLSGLEHAHSNGILHRDIKPANIMFGTGLVSKLSDFGLAIDYNHTASDLVGYMPHQPLEVVEGAPMDTLSDIYAMGITFFRLLNNLKGIPYSFKTRPEWAKELKRETYPKRDFAAHIPEKILRILKKAMHSKRDKRYPACSDFRHALEKLLFSIDWRPADQDTWIGNDPTGNRCELTKSKSRNGWNLDYKKNGIRKSVYSRKGLSDVELTSNFFEILRVTTLA